MSKKEPVCIDITNIDFEDPVNNLIFNMSGGLLPSDLSEDEIKLLTERFGANWFHRLGYKEEDGYINPERR
jgi:hypothetical protein